MEIEGEEHNSLYRDWLNAKYKEIMEAYLDAYYDGFGTSLFDFMGYLEEKNKGDMLEHRYFYDFWLILHQRSPILHGSLAEEDGSKSLLNGALTVLGRRSLIVEEGKEIVSKVSRYSIQQMIFTMEEDL